MELQKQAPVMFLRVTEEEDVYEMLKGEKWEKIHLLNSDRALDALTVIYKVFSLDSHRSNQVLRFLKKSVINCIQIQIWHFNETKVHADIISLKSNTFGDKIPKQLNYFSGISAICMGATAHSDQFSLQSDSGYV